MRISKRTCRDFEACLKFFDPQFNPNPSPLARMGEKTPLECFADLESRGIVPESCNDPETLKMAMDGKSQLGVHIEQIWASNVRNAFQVVDSGRQPSFYTAWIELCQLMNSDLGYLPEWVWKAVWASAVGRGEFYRLHEFGCMVERFGMHGVCDGPCDHPSGLQVQKVKDLTPPWRNL